MRNAAISAATRFVTLDCDEAPYWVGETGFWPQKETASAGRLRRFQLLTTGNGETGGAFAYAGR
jgi:hypothetical protein